VGLEFAQVFRRFGSRVTVLHRGERILSREDADVADAVREILAAEGVRFVPRSRIERVRPGAEGGVEVCLGLGADEPVVAGTHLLVATGRVPNSDRLDLEAAAIDVDEHGHVIVDDRLRTSAEGVFALGDVNGRGAFTHTAANDGEIVVDALRGGPRRVTDRVPIAAVFIDPPLGRVGLSEREALERGHRVLKATMPMSRINRAREMGETQGFVKLLVDADSDRLLGAAVLGVHGDEVANMLGAVMTSGQPWQAFRRTVLIHPTVGELMPWALDGLEPV
jgi:pyruvate/2-oxoglutarate dehydrogenase complex dihydrolipoamide dehydrogenase (E3) component